MLFLYQNVVIIFLYVFLQHIALIIMFIFAYIVPDTPADVALKKRKVHVLLFR